MSFSNQIAVFSKVHINQSSINIIYKLWVSFKTSMKNKMFS